jgi:hypothetical protein
MNNNDLKRFASFLLVLVMFGGSVYLLLEGGGKDWKCFCALVLAIATGVVGTKTNFGSL